ncbi:hypothetical protein GCM10011581_30030 [Saccharopolyspora subtropica]|uniref:Uncharacterized protein n=1 Tax=Saccharopolyspora thermophila TaxID=89367 RepID=A0A917JXM7_9PSEU|nr:hypothetical protein [Saccharopolyspora subtropica]GGI90995.1 hypothetical protein GCM10011581_30030 [Saccharopolyspora subtropica]
MVNRPDDDAHATDRHHASALRLLETGPHAPRCPHGHGPLTTTNDPDAPTGVAMTCPHCGHRRSMEVRMLRALLTPHPTQPDQPLTTTTPPQPETPPLTDDTVELPARTRADLAREPLGKLAADDTRHSIDLDDDLDPQPPARGSQPDGTIRTTGWLQLGPWPISSGVWALLTGAALGLALIDLATWLTLALPAATFTTWYATIRWIRPASAARNLGRAPAAELLPGEAVRLYGPIGPVGIVDQVTPAHHQQVLVRYAGGTQHLLPAASPRHIVELRN